MNESNIAFPDVTTSGAEYESRWPKVLALGVPPRKLSKLFVYEWRGNLSLFQVYASTIFLLDLKATFIKLKNIHDREFIFFNFNSINFQILSFLLDNNRHIRYSKPLFTGSDIRCLVKVKKYSALQYSKAW